jgi:hypothetical protein
VIDGQFFPASATVGTLELISDENVSFGKGHTASVNGSDQLDQPHHSGNFQLHPAAISNRAPGVFDDFHLTFGHQANCPFPVYQV